MIRPTTEVSVKVRKITAKAIGVADGTDEENAFTGELTEKLFWLPKSQVEVNPPEFKVGDTVTVTLPEWLGIDKGLL